MNRACMDRCEVCQRVIEHRPDPKRRRCRDHLHQLALVPLPRRRTSCKTTNENTDEGRA